MYAKRVLDSEGREWKVERRCTPWRRLVRPTAMHDPSYGHRGLTQPEAQPAEPAPDERMSRGWMAVAVVLAPLAVVESIGVALFVIFVLPLVALELALLGIAGFCLGLARAAGLARQRVDVTCGTGNHLHSDTVLLVHGRRRARQLVEELAADRYAARRSFWPTRLPADVTVRSHRSVWQAPDKWVPRVTRPSGSGTSRIRQTQLAVLTMGTFVILLVAVTLGLVPG